MKINNDVRNAIKRLIPVGKINERQIEIPFVFSSLPESVKDGKRLRVLDIGTCESNIIIELGKLGYDVVGIDMRDYEHRDYEHRNFDRDCKHSNVRFIKCDARNMRPIFADNLFDITMAISTLEHIGLVTHYRTDIVIDKDGDKKALAEILRVTKFGGMILITLPYGVGHAMLSSWVRFYNKDRIKELFDIRGSDGSKLAIDRMKYSIRVGDKWSECDERTASVVPSHSTYVNGNVCIVGHKNIAG